MHTNPSIPIAFAVCASMTASCAASPPMSMAAPRLALPEAASRPCDMAVLPAAATLADLETAYVQRGEQLVRCDGSRRLAVETLLAERFMIDAWSAETNNPSGWWRPRPDGR